MCGIAGILAADGPDDALRSRVEVMTQCLRHRGPDDHGVSTGPGWAVGMRRLAIQDTSEAGHQPMRLGDLTLVFNGEVYNFPELRDELGALGHEFRSGSDTEVVLCALHEWGTSALARFNGMFALVLVDERRRRAWLARDRFGKKPLYVGALLGGVHFASELKSIMAVAGEQLTVSTTALAQFFRHRYVPSPLSIFDEVGKVPAGSWVEVDLLTGRASPPRVFWRLPAPDPGARPADVDEVLETVGAAVRRRLIADVPVGAFLSGGVDSSLVVACMCDARPDVRTFSIGFEDPRFDETRYAKAVARHLGTEHTHQQLEWRDAMQLVPTLADSFDEPFADASALPTLAVSRLARRDVTVALSGDGGDELFGGYRRYVPNRGLRVAAALPRPVGDLLRRVPGTRPIARRARLVGGLAAVGGTREVYRERLSVWSSHELPALVPGARDVDLGPPFAVPGAGPTELMMRHDAATYLVDDILHKVDRASMSVGLEARNPLLDPDVVALAVRSVRRAEEQPGRKALLREAVSRRLPKELVERPKMGFAVPVGTWLRGGLRPLVDDLLLGRDATEYDGGVARAVVEDHLAGRRDATQLVWTLLVLELWKDRWRRPAPGTAPCDCPDELRV